ncbi:MAG: HAMP domain-containing sensor histidine kinase, partial [Planctomycetota bacterium]|nr:HAMP domain-containing sensor histidine kinase [Planctomycetota bacterium]
IEKGLAFAIQDSKGNILVSQGDDRSLRNQNLPLLSKRLEMLPFWRITVRRNPQTIASSATQRSLLLAGLIALALLGVAFGAVSTFRFVNQSLELASLKSDFLSSITHELKTPLTSIQMFSEMLSLGRIKNDEKRMEYYKHITSESIRLRGMIDDILDFARSEAGKVHYVLSEADFAELVQDALDIFYLSAEAKGFEIKSDLPDFGEFPPVDVDREAMVRVFVNLLSNAVKYSLENPEISVQVKRDGHLLLASVADKGVGIESKNLEKIFDKFFRAGDPLTREVSGTGLGLSLVHGIVRAHDGDIRVTSEKNVGSTFTVALPIVEDYRDKWPPDAEVPTQSEFTSSEDTSHSSALMNSEEQTSSAVDEQGG